MAAPELEAIFKRQAKAEKKTFAPFGPAGVSSPRNPISSRRIIQRRFVNHVSHLQGSAVEDDLRMARRREPTGCVVGELKLSAKRG
jgi:hypothetical protein